jgi:hypothetical protein
MLGKKFHQYTDWWTKGGLRKPQDWLWFSKRKIDNFKQHFYVCGPQFVTAISEALTQLGAKPMQ